MNINGVGAASYKSHGEAQKIQAEPRVNTSSQLEQTKKTAEDIDKKAMQRAELKNNIMEKALKQANMSLESANRYFKRQIHEKTGIIIYTLHDSKTEEVLAEFPQKKLQDMLANMWENAGLFIDTEA